MTPTDHQPAELFDLDRYEGKEISDEQWNRMQPQFDRLFRERWAAQERANHAMQEERDRRANVRKAYRLVAFWALFCLALSALSIYFRLQGD